MAPAGKASAAPAAPASLPRCALILAAAVGLLAAAAPALRRHAAGGVNP
jgi:retinol dehydrogenase 12